MDKDAVPDAMGYYPVIYYLHIGMVIATSVSSLIYTFYASLLSPTLKFISIFFTVILLISFIWYCVRCYPKKIGNLIEECRIIWVQVFIYMTDKQVKGNI